MYKSCSEDLGISVPSQVFLLTSHDGSEINISGELRCSFSLLETNGLENDNVDKLVSELQKIVEEKYVHPISMKMKKPG